MSNDISQYFFSSSPVIGALNKSDVARFREHLRLKRMAKGKELYHEGSYPKAVYILKRGKVKIYHEGPSGTEKIIYLYSEGEMFGYRPLICGEKHPASAKTVEESSIYVLPAKQFLRVLSESTSLSNVLLKNLSHEFTVLVNLIGAFAQKSVKERTALSLLILREKYRKGDKGGAVYITLSRSDLASFVGTTIESIARIIRWLKDEKIIKTYGRHIVIVNERELLKLIG